MPSRNRIAALAGLAATAALAAGVGAGWAAAPGPASGQNPAARAQAAADQWAQLSCVPGWDPQAQVLVVCGWRGALPDDQGLVAVPFREAAPRQSPKPQVSPAPEAPAQKPQPAENPEPAQKPQPAENPQPAQKPQPALDARLRALPEAATPTGETDDAATATSDVVVAWPVPAASADSGFSVPAALAGALGALAAATLAALAGAAWRARTQRAAAASAVATGSGSLGGRAYASTAPHPARPTPPSSAVPVPLAPAVGTARPNGSDPLVQAAIEVRDVVPSAALAARLGEALSARGISEVDPVGKRFDPATQTAIATVPAADPRLVGLVAHTERLGYRDDGHILRFAQVTVFRQRNGSS